MTAAATPSIFVNGHSIGTGGGYTVGREITRGIAEARPDWRVTLGVIKDHPLQRELEREALPANVEVVWAPAKVLHPFTRSRYESGVMAPRLNAEGCSAVVQLNGMVVPGVKAPTLAHFQDPFPYRPEAWTTLKERVAVWFKRQAHRCALRDAAVCGWTSQYLAALTVGYHGIKPKRSVVFYNGVPESWVERSRGPLTPLAERPLKIVTVSNVWVYKRQWLVIDALAKLRKRPGLEKLEYHILGAGPEDYLQELRNHAQKLGLAGAVHVEGRVSDERVAEAFAEARAMPLMSVCESFGIPMVEAMASGTPVVAADCCALPEVAGDAALLAPVDDADALAERIERVLTDAELAQRLREAGVRRVADFRWSVIGERMAEVLEEMVRGNTDTKAK